VADPAEQQWLDFFAKGGRHDVPYNIQYLMDARREQTAMNLVGQSALNAGVQLGLNSMHAAVLYSYFGGQQNPVIGVSGLGLHLPTVPLVRWADLAAVLIDNLREVWLRASNRFMIPDPGMGGAVMSTEAQITLVAVNGQELLASVNTPNCEYAVTVRSTASGAQWGSSVVQLDPALGAEQVVQLVYLVNLMCRHNGVKIYHTGGLTGEFQAFGIHRQILAMN
jgi:hypothetical protein